MGALAPGRLPVPRQPGKFSQFVLDLVLSAGIMKCLCCVVPCRQAELPLFSSHLCLPRSNKHWFQPRSATMCGPVFVWGWRTDNVYWEGVLFDEEERV